MERSPVEEILDVLRDPQVIEATRGQGRARSVDDLIHIINRRTGTLGHAARTYPALSGGCNGIRIVVGHEPRQIRMHAYMVTDNYVEFESHGVRKESLAEALVCGYFVGELMDDPIPDNFV